VITGWVLVILASVPFDISAPFGFMPKLSLIDYEAAAALLALIFHYRPHRLIRVVSTIMGRASFLAWAIFLFYLTITAFILKGSLKDVFRWGEFIFVYILALLAVRENAPYLRKTAAALSVGLSACIALWGIKQFFASGHDYTQTFAMFKQHNGFAAYLSLALPAAWALAISVATRVRKIIAGMAALVITCAFLVAYSRGAWLGIAGALFFVSLLSLTRRRNDRRALIMSVLLFVASAAAPVLWVIHREHNGQTVLMAAIPLKTSIAQDSTRLLNLSARTFYWKTAADIIREKPWFGLGPGHYADQIRSFLKGYALTLFDKDLRYNGGVLFWQHLHNAYLQFLVEYGWVGFILWALAMSVMCRPLFVFPLKTSSTQLAFMVSGLAFLIHNNWDYLYVNSFDLVFAIWVALCAKEASSHAA